MNNCTSCGMPIGENQGSSCSMCYGDIAHGTDGYYQEWAEQQNKKTDDWQEDEFIPCSKCDGHQACEDFGCAFSLGLSKMVNKNII